MKQVSELEGQALDWAVAKAEGTNPRLVKITNRFCVVGDQGYEIPKYSNAWAYGGPVIERERIATWWLVLNKKWAASNQLGADQMFGLTPLIAAMRFHVAWKLGNEIDIPEELC